MRPPIRPWQRAWLRAMASASTGPGTPFTPAGAPTAHWSFLETLYLAAIYTAFGVHPLAARLITALLSGLLLPWLAYRLSHRARRDVACNVSTARNISTMTAALAAIYPYFVLYGAMLQTEAFYICALLWSLERAIALTVHPVPRDTDKHENGVSASIRARQRRPRLVFGFDFQEPVRSGAVLGLSLGIATLLRQSILPWVVILFAWLLWQALRPPAVAPPLPTQGGGRGVGRYLPPLAALFIAGGCCSPASRPSRCATTVPTATSYYSTPMRAMPCTRRSTRCTAQTSKSSRPRRCRRIWEAGIERSGVGQGAHGPWSRLRAGRPAPLRPPLTQPRRRLLRILAATDHLTHQQHRPHRILDPICAVHALRPVSHASPFAHSPIRPFAPRPALPFHPLLQRAPHPHLAMPRYRLPVDAVLLIFAALGIVDLGARLKVRFAVGAPVTLRIPLPRRQYPGCAGISALSGPAPRLTSSTKDRTSIPWMRCKPMKTAHPRPSAPVRAIRAVCVPFPKQPPMQLITPQPSKPLTRVHLRPAASRQPICKPKSLVTRRQHRHQGTRLPFRPLPTITDRPMIPIRHIHLLPADIDLQHLRRPQRQLPHPGQRLARRQQSPCAFITRSSQKRASVPCPASIGCTA